FLRMNDTTNNYYLRRLIPPMSRHHWLEGIAAYHDCSHDPSYHPMTCTMSRSVKFYGFFY
ncbi:hypothetical protein HAX54_044606, partial [Datura stramonium]|nr:hypothetical protein [Datura stramonium]